MSSPAERLIDEHDSAAAQRRRVLDTVLPALVAVLVVAAFENSTNFIDIVRFKWDNVRYLAMADRWFAPADMASPFAYRWGTPALARIISDTFSVSTTLGFRVLAWLGAGAQLVAVFWLVREVFSSTKAGWAGFTVTALSVWNVRFLTFDPYRPDPLAYPIIILASLAALKQRWGWVLVLTLLGSPFREFAVVPLLAVLATLMTTKNWQTLRRLILPAVAVLAVSVVLPRALITVVEDNRQTVTIGSFIDDLDYLIGYPGRHLNILLGYLSYFVPVLMLATFARLRGVSQGIDRPFRHYLRWYSLLVFALVFMGGTDIHRFVTFMVVPLAIAAGGLAIRVRPIELIVAFAATFWFNRLVEPIPDVEVLDYKNFWAAYSGLVNLSTLQRFLWAAVCLALGWGTQWLTRRAVRRPPAQSRLRDPKDGPPPRPPKRTT